MFGNDPLANNQYPPVNLLKMAIEIVDLPIKNDDSP